MAESARGALEDAGLSLKDVDGLFTSGVSGMGIVSLAEHLNLVPDFFRFQFYWRVVLRLSYRNTLQRQLPRVTVTSRLFLYGSKMVLRSVRYRRWRR